MKLSKADKKRDVELHNKAHESGNTKFKGIEGKNCNVTHCQLPDSAIHFNNMTKAWYCTECAMNIEAAALKTGHSFFTSLT